MTTRIEDSYYAEIFKLQSAIYTRQHNSLDRSYNDRYLVEGNEALLQTDTSVTDIDNTCSLRACDSIGRNMLMHYFEASYSISDAIDAYRYV